MSAYGLGGVGTEHQFDDAPKRRQDPAELLVSKLIAAVSKPISLDALAELLGVLPLALERPLRDLASRGLVIPSETPDGIIYKRAMGQTASGYVTRQQRGGLGFMPDDRSVPLMEIEQDGEGGALPGDRVLVTWHAAGSRRGPERRGSGRGSPQARVATIIAQRPTEVTGIAEINGVGDWILRLWGQNKPRELMLDLPDGVKIKPGELVRAKLPRSVGRAGMIASFISVVASMDVPGQDAEAVAAMYDFPVAFSAEALEWIKGLPDDPEVEDFAGRLDLRDQLIITIDPKDARDHDDAISVTQLADGNMQLGVHIADVAQYVRPGSELHAEAWQRATSVYLPGKTIPMLPEKLSAGLCSLKEGCDRLAVSCFMVFDAKGVELRRELHRSVIRVKHFLNYEQALGVLEGRLSVSPDVDALLIESRKLADVLNRARLDAGSIVLSIDRPHLVLGGVGELVAVQTERSDASHNLVEECMLAANRAVASFLLDSNSPYICRVHPSPDEEAEAEFGEFCERLGVGAPNFEDPRRVQMFLDGVKGREGAHAINLAVLKSMKRATYSAQPGLHYALGFHEYTHFTSPIRRLCDLTVHQTVRAYMESSGEFKWQSRRLEIPWRDGKPSDAKVRRLNGADVSGSAESRLAMPATARQASEREQVAQRAEMEVVQLKLLRLLQERVGEKFEATVTHIANHGIVFQLDEVWCEGTVFYFDLSQQWITPRKFWVDVEMRGGTRTFKVGDRATVVVDEVIVPTRVLKLKLTESGTALKKRDGGFEFSDMRKRGR